MSTRATPKNSVEEEVFRDMCRKFAEKEIAPRHKEADAQRRFPRELYVAGAKAGLIGVSAPEAVGGGDFGLVEEMISIEEQAKISEHLANVPLLQGLVGSLLYGWGNEGHRDIARANNAGECLLALAVTEPEAGNDVQGLKTSAVRMGDEWELDGQKCFITLADESDVLLVLARTDPQKGRRGMHFFAVDRRSPGVEISRIETYVYASLPTYRVMLNRVKVPESRRLEAGFTEVMAGFNRERVLVCARWIGHMQFALAWALEYAKVRHQFGKPIGANQSIAFPLAQAHVDITASRQMAYSAARKWDSGVPIADLMLEVSSAKLFTTQAAQRVTQAALHTAGGWGLTRELPIMQYAIDSFAAGVTVGSYEIQLRVIAKALGLPCE